MLDELLLEVEGDAVPLLSSSSLQFSNQNPATFFRHFTDQTTLESKLYLAQVNSYCFSWSHISLNDVFIPAEELNIHFLASTTLICFLTVSVSW